MIFHMNQGKKRRSGPLELIIQPRVSSLMVTNQLLHRVYKYKCKSIQIHTYIKYKYKCILLENVIKQKMSLTSLIVSDHILHVPSALMGHYGEKRNAKNLAFKNAKSMFQVSRMNSFHWCRFLLVQRVLDKHKK